MSVQYLDLKNQRFGNLTAIELVNDFEKNGTTKKWKCKCDCGNYINVSARILNYARKRKRNISCGCSRKTSYLGKIFGDYIVLKYIGSTPDKKHKRYLCECKKCGKQIILNSLQLYKCKKCQECQKNETKKIKKIKNVLYRMKQRCYNENDKSYINYGFRGIKICDEWLGNSDNFVKWFLSNKNDDNVDLTIDRIDNNGNYCPENCRLVNRKIQNNNKRNNIIIEYNNKKQTLKQWCEELNLPYRKTHKRLYELGWSVEKAFSQESKK